VPHRGKKNEPAFVGRVAETLGTLWGVSAEQVANVTTRNFERTFGVEVTR
jgi:TatD DNase family protein